MVSSACFTSCNNHIEITKTRTSELNMRWLVKPGYNTEVLNNSA